MSSPSALIKVNYLVIRYLHFGSVLGDLQEGNGCAFLCYFLSSWCQSPSSRAQNRGFCALLAAGTPVFRVFEHKIEVFVRFWASEPLFSGISSTKSGFLCFFRLRNPHFRAFRAQNRGFCALLASKTLIFRSFEHKNGVFVLGKTGNGIGKCNRGDAYRKRGLPANHRARLKNANAS